MVNLFSIKQYVSYLVAALVLLPVLIHAQSSSQPNYTGINASKFLLIFNETSEEVDVAFRRYISEHTNLRSGFSLGFSSNENDLSTFSLRLGIEHNLNKSNRWDIYSYADILYDYSQVNNTPRSQSETGVVLGLGFLYKIGKHFSIATEPGLGIFRNLIKDESNFNGIDEESWYEAQFNNIGQVRLGFHF